MQLDLSRLSRGEKVAGGAAILLFIAMFFAWFGVDTGLGDLERQFGVKVPSTTVSHDAWESFSFVDWVLLATVLLAVATAVLKALGRKAQFPFNNAVALLGGIATALVLYRIVDPPNGDQREWGVFVGLVLSALIAYGGYRAMQEEGVSFGDAADRLSSH